MKLKQNANWRTGGTKPNAAPCARNWRLPGTALTSRETAIREIQAAAEQTNAHWRQKLAVAETAWKTGEAQRLKLTEAALRQEFEQTLAALPSRADADAAAARQAQELRDLQESVATLRGDACRPAGAT